MPPPLTGVPPSSVCKSATERTFAEGEDYTATDFVSGVGIGMSVGDWLAAAGISLNDFNYDLTPDYRDPAVYPTLRSSGVTLDVIVHLTNREAGSYKPGYDNKIVKASVMPKAVTNNWVGNGPTIHYESYPTGPPGARRFAKVVRYRQGIAFRFRSAGRMFMMNWMYLFDVILGALVLMNASKGLTRLYATTCAGHDVASMISSRAVEERTVESHFADLGLKAALAANQFQHLSQGDGKIDPVDLCVPFAGIEGLTFDQAYDLTHIVLAAIEKASSNQEGQGAKKYDVETGQEAELDNNLGLFSLLWGGTKSSAQGFAQLLDKASTRDLGSMPELVRDREKCEKAFNEARSSGVVGVTRASPGG